MATHQASGAPLRAVSIRCNGCGAAFGVLPTPGQAQCPYCQREQLISPQMLAQFEQYGRAVQVEFAQAEAALDRAASGQAFRKHYPKRRAKYLATAVLTAQAGIGAVIVAQAQFHFLTPETATVIYYIAVGVPVVLLLWVSRRRSSKPASTAPVEVSGLRVACSNCGAVAEMAPGAAAHRCPYCQTAIVASQVVMQSGVSAVVTAHRQARLGELRESRRVAATVNFGANWGTPYLVGVPLVVVFFGKAIGTVTAAQRGEPIDEVEDFYVPVAATLALVVGLLALFFFRRARRSSCRSALHALFAPYPSTEIETREALADWLNQHWSDAYDMYRADSGRYFVCAHTTIASYPLLLRANLWPTSELEGPTLHLLLAAQLQSPESLPAAVNPTAAQAINRCRALGFDVQFSEAGLLAVATAAKLDSLRRSPRELSELGPVMHALPEVAASVGAAPG
jgi:DNA-directed RNA polymerase subunit RPC12/RpoP